MSSTTGSSEQDYWGRAISLLLRSAASRSSDPEELRRHISSLVRCLPCAVCRRHAETFLSNNSPSKISDTESGNLFVARMRSYIEERLGGERAQFKTLSSSSVLGVQRLLRTGPTPSPPSVTGRQLATSQPVLRRGSYPQRDAWSRLLDRRSSKREAPSSPSFDVAARTNRLHRRVC
jgi:hypothetical protein